MNALITGGTNGLGLGIATQLAQHHWNVTITGRNAQRGAQLASELGLTYIQSDLSRPHQTYQLANTIAQPLDALILCAGSVSFLKQPQLTPDGLETTFATNYLTRYCLTQHLLPKMNPGGRIIMVSGNGRHQRTSTDWARPDAGMNAAFKAALAVDLYAAELAAQAPHLRVHTCYPGMVRTGLLNQAPAPMRLFVRLFGVSLQQGAAHFTRLIVEDHDGVHWNQDKPLQFNPALPSGLTTRSLLKYSRAVHARYGVLQPTSIAPSPAWQVR